MMNSLMVPLIICLIHTLRYTIIYHFLNKNANNFGMESPIKKIKRSLESALEWLSNDVLISEIIKYINFLFLHITITTIIISLIELVWKVGRYTSAAPIYFTECDNYVDGGLLANNPCSDALTKIQVYYDQLVSIL